MWPASNGFHTHMPDHFQTAASQPHAPPSPYGFEAWPTNHQRYMNPQILRDYLPPNQSSNMLSPYAPFGDRFGQDELQQQKMQYSHPHPGFDLPYANFPAWHQPAPPITHRYTSMSPIESQYGVRPSHFTTGHNVCSLDKFNAPFQSISNPPLGPPVKPKRSGHALWVGNLNPATTISELKDHFSRSATDDIESVFLITRSTCAFVNYRSEQACRSAHARFHSTRLTGNALVCRPRRDLEPNTRADSASPSSSSSESQISDSSSYAPSESPTTPVIVGAPTKTPSTPAAVLKTTSAKIQERFFILKSSTLQDLETSVRNSSWVTQLHNERSLKSAFESAEIVYLIFSANKSREYFGVARMSSSPGNKTSPLENQAHSSRAELTPKAPKFISTPATATAPSGRIVNDPARGTVFWEAVRSEETDAEKQASMDIDVEDRMGAPFSVEWLCLTKVPFFRTRGLRNPWNSNREIKVARDGTEIEPNTGRRLLALFANAFNTGVGTPGMYI